MVKFTDEATDFNNDVDKVVALLHEADAAMQRLGIKNDLCYELHNRISDIADDIEDLKVKTG